MAAPQGNPGGGMFAKYSGEQINQIPAGYVEAMGSMGKAYAQIGAQLGDAFKFMAGEKVKQENLQSTAQGLLDSYTNGDPESAMYSDSTPNHVKQFLDRSFSAGGVDKLSQRDLNAFVAGEQAYNSKIDREIKLRQIAATELTAANKGDTAVERFNKAIQVGTSINKATSPAFQTRAAQAAPTVENIVIAKATEARVAKEREVDVFRQAYNTAKEEVDKVRGTEFTEDPSGNVVQEIDVGRMEGNAQVALQNYEKKKQEAPAAGQQAFLAQLSKSFENPQEFSSAITKRRDSILEAINVQKTQLRNAIAGTYGPEAAMAINITEEDQKFADAAAREIPAGKVFQSPEGYGWEWDGAKFVFKTAKQLGNESDEVVLPEGLDYTKGIYGGLSQEQFYNLPEKVQSKILQNTKLLLDSTNAQLTAAKMKGELAGNTLTPEKFFGWKGYLPGEVEMRKVIDLTTGRKTMEFSIDQIIQAYQKFGVSRSISPEARAVFRATRPALIAAVRPQVAGGNQQSDTELRTILAALPMGEDISSLKEYDIAQYRFMKIMYAKHYESHMSSIPGLEKDVSPITSDYNTLPSRTRDLIDSFSSGTGAFAGLDNTAKMEVLKSKLDQANAAKSPYTDSSGNPIGISSYNKEALTAASTQEYVNREAAKLQGEDKKVYDEVRSRFPSLNNATNGR